MTGAMKDIEWFKQTVEPLLKGYEVKYSYYENGDFGSLNQIEFNSEKIGGSVDFWGLGWLGVFVWNYETNEQVFNVLVEAGNEVEKEKALMELIRVLKNT